jgi:hypothetical protein
MTSFLLALGAGCGEEASEVSDDALPRSLTEARDALAAAGHEVRAVTAGPLDTPAVVVEGDELIVVLDAATARYASQDSISVFNRIAAESIDSATEFHCDSVVVAGPDGAGLRDAAKATGRCD